MRTLHVLAILGAKDWAVNEYIAIFTRPPPSLDSGCQHSPILNLYTNFDAVDKGSANLEGHSSRSQSQEGRVGECMNGILFPDVRSDFFPQKISLSRVLTVDHTPLRTHSHQAVSPSILYPTGYCRNWLLCTLPVLLCYPIEKLETLLLRVEPRLRLGSCYAVWSVWLNCSVHSW